MLNFLVTSQPETLALFRYKLGFNITREVTAHYAHQLRRKSSSCC